jgi:hypothetical protein
MHLIIPGRTSTLNVVAAAVVVVVVSAILESITNVVCDLQRAINFMS